MAISKYKNLVTSYKDGLCIVTYSVYKQFKDIYHVKGGTLAFNYTGTDMDWTIHVWGTNPSNVELPEKYNGIIVVDDR